MAQTLIALPQSHAAWGQTGFALILKHEVEALSHDLLPLQQALAYSSVVADEAITVLVGRVDEQSRSVRIAVLYSGLIAGCNCADDPAPAELTLPERCELELVFEADGAVVSVRVLTD